jgi:vacuolar-type H+-ATPase subunit H
LLQEFHLSYTQQALREVSRIESDVDPVVETIEDEIQQNDDVQDATESDTEVPNEVPNDTREICSKCDVLAKKVIQLQKKISCLKQSKQKLSDSVNVVGIN